ncbi:MAG: hypothetical protein PHD39_04120 [Methylobacter tundripaludum]|nr:hypothetical protein [Methylobacter tundripaludum]
MKALDKGNIKQAVAGILFSTLMAGCAEWNSHPVVAEQNFGRAVNNMVKNQTLCPEHGYKAQNPTLCPEHGPVMGIDGQKAQAVIRAYREGASEKLDEAKQGPTFDVKNVGK